MSSFRCRVQRVCCRESRPTGAYVNQGSSFNHVGIGVAEIGRAVGFYVFVFGCEVLRAPFEVRANGPRGDQPVDVLKPPAFRHMKMAHLASGNGIGIELFQLIDPPHEPRSPQLEYWKSGVFHLSFTASDIEAKLAAVIEAGGRQLSQIWINDPEDDTKKMVYCADPWGTILELYTHDYGDMYAVP